MIPLSKILMNIWGVFIVIFQIGIGCLMIRGLR